MRATWKRTAVLKQFFAFSLQIRVIDPFKTCFKLPLYKFK